MTRHAFIIGFTILLLFFLYQEGDSLAEGFRRVLRRRIGERADGYIELATRAVRASVNSMLVVALFDGFASGVAYAIAGVPHAAVWASITGLLALVPFLGYAAVVALTLQLVMTGAATPPLLAFALGSIVLFCGDKIVRPVIAREGIHLRFVWVLMGCPAASRRLTCRARDRSGNTHPRKGTLGTTSAISLLLTSPTRNPQFLADA
jgi:predicted PurR-regulated permease PerM